MKKNDIVTVTIEDIFWQKRESEASGNKQKRKGTE